MPNEEFLDKLKKSTDQKIEDNLAHGAYSSDHRPIAERELERRRREGSDAALAEQIDTAKSAKDAAWASANEAKGANTRATIAIVVSILAFMAGAAGLFVSVWRDPALW